MRVSLTRHMLTAGAALVVASVVITAIIAGFSVQVCRDWAFICENTGSHKGYRQWCVGLRAGHWYRESRLEQFLRKQHPAELVNRWTSYSGTGKNILAQPVRFGHARPGPILDVNITLFDRYVEGLEDQAKLDLYHVFASGTPEQVKTEVDKIWERAIAEGWEMRSERRGRK